MPRISEGDQEEMDRGGNAGERVPRRKPGLPVSSTTGKHWVVGHSRHKSAQPGILFQEMDRQGKCRGGWCVKEVHGNEQGIPV